MIVPDLNLLLYAYNPHVPQHRKAADWWEKTMNAGELIGLPNEVCFGFVRIATNSRIGAAAVTLDQAREVVNNWINLPQARILLPGPHHFEQVMELMAATMGSGDLLSDAVLAAYAIQNRATLCSNDGDFARFAGLTWRNPLLED